MVYLNNNDGLYYTDEQFTTVANGFFADVLYVNGSRSFSQFDANSSFTGYVSIVRNNGLYYTDDALTNLANGRIDGVADSFVGEGVHLPGAPYSEQYVYFIDGQITGLHFDGSGYWNEELYVYGVTDFTGSYGGAQGANEGFYINGVRTTLDLWNGHGVWNNKIYGTSGNATHLGGFKKDVQIDNYNFTQLTDLTGVDFSDVISLGGDDWLSRTNFGDINLSGIDFSRFESINWVDFYNATLVDTNFSGVTFGAGVSIGGVASGANFDGATFSGNSSFWSQQLQGATFIDAVFNCDISSSNFEGANLAGANFSNATTYDQNSVSFNGAADITNTIFPSWFAGVVNGVFQLGSSATLIINANLSGADLTGVDFSNITAIYGTSFDYAILSGAILPANISGISFRNANLTGADFSNITSVAYCNFSGAILTGVDFSNVTDWNGADFSDAYLTGAILPLEMTGSIGISGIINNKPYWNSSATNLDGADFNGQDLTGVDFSNVTSIAGAYFANADLTGVDFSNVTSLENVNFEGATLTGATLPSSISGSYGNVYFISGQATGLDGNGTGEFEGLRYENGTLFTGDFEGQAYVNGVVQGGGGDNGGGGGIKNGWVDGVYYINDVATTLNDYGHGTWNGKVYYNGSIRNGYDPMAGMIAGQWGYYIDGVVTELDNEGNGEWNGQTYVNGVVQGGGGGPTGALTKIAGSAKFYGKVKFVG
jgi:uncharacterized protein YjbI with pentapeptide repeats